MKIVVDCANGASYKAAPRILWELGADVITMGCNPNGININEGCGATDPQSLAYRVVEEQADLGIALDGDGDRLVMVDEVGAIVHGDIALALLATSWKKSNLLNGKGVVGTILSNGALDYYLNSIDIPFYRSPVGDRFVSKYMQNHESVLGGEPSGHIVMRNFCQTGDGIIAALQLLALVMQKKSETSSEIIQLSSMCQLFDLLPQVSCSVPLSAPRSSLDLAGLAPIIHQAETQLEAVKGRLIVRPSGTEPVLRLMAEGEDKHAIQSVIKQLSGDLTHFLSL